MHILPYCGAKNLFDLEKIQPWIIKWMCVYLCADCRVCTVHNIKWKCCAQNREINIKKNNIAMMYKISKGYLNVVFSSIPICFALVELLCLICVNWEHFTSRSGIFQKMFGRSNFKNAQNATKVFKLLLNLEKWSLFDMWIFKRKWNAVQREEIHINSKYTSQTCAHFRNEKNHKCFCNRFSLACESIASAMKRLYCGEEYHIDIFLANIKCKYCALNEAKSMQMVNKIMITCGTRLCFQINGFVNFFYASFIFSCSSQFSLHLPWIYL